MFCLPADPIGKKGIVFQHVLKGNLTSSPWNIIFSRPVDYFSVFTVVVPVSHFPNLQTFCMSLSMHTSNLTFLFLKISFMLLYNHLLFFFFFFFFNLSMEGLAGRMCSLQLWQCRLASASYRSSLPAGRCFQCSSCWLAWDRYQTMWQRLCLVCKSCWAQCAFFGLVLFLLLSRTGLGLTCFAKQHC